MAERVDDAELSMNQLEALKDMAIDNIRKQAQVVSRYLQGSVVTAMNRLNQAFIVTLNVRNGTGKSRPQNSVNMACDRQDLTDYVALY
ncbi:hypothetical protein O5162_24460 [Escherichia coli]|uniref:hypothetical protein n=1 Tax=Shigella flexneri TaxID=623 RepID=UPI0022C46D7E|nr:hypothetical protein [Shigella flexneri]MCZ5950203.1 hypothetical protein [Escherichia coli]